MYASSLRQRDPALFSGTDDHDAEEWLAFYEKVSTYKKRDDATIVSIIINITGVANLWYQNHEHDIPKWASFEAQLSEVFGRPAVCELGAEQRVRESSHVLGESFTSCIEDFVNMCARVNAEISETDKMKHILKEKEDYAFQMLLSRDLCSVPEVVTLCQSYDELRKQRILTRKHI